MDKQQTFLEFFTTQSVPVPLLAFVINLCMTGIFAYFLGRVYVRCGQTLSNRNMFSKNLILIAMTTMLIISIVKSSLALSLGLVGALSIVRFRAAIKEPEELTYLFLAIGLGLGFGADQKWITMTALVIISAFLLVRSLAAKHKEEHPNLLLTLRVEQMPNIDINDYIVILKEFCSHVDLKRLDQGADFFDASFLVEYIDLDCLKKSIDKLKIQEKNIRVTLLNHEGVY